MKILTKKESKVIGRTDRADFPEFELSELTVKIDSGAYTSAIHCCKIDQNAEDELEVIFLDDKDPKYTGEIHRFSDFERKNVRSSNGITEERFIITTKIKLGKIHYAIKLSLTHRGDMRSPVLIGRKFLARNHFVVNPRLRNHLYKSSLKK